MLNNLIELSKNFMSELKDPWLWFFAAAAGLLIFIVLASRFVARIAPFKNHQKIIWTIDIVFIPSFILCVESILKRIVGPETITFIKNIELVSASVLWLVSAWLLARALNLFLWGTTFKEKREMRVHF